MSLPNTPDLAAELADHHQAMLTHGFTAPNEEGEPVCLKLTKKGSAKALGADHLDKLDATTTYFPAEIELVRRHLREELRRRDHAGQILAALKLAISELESHLLAEKRNEAKLQRCLTDNPILFGIDYVRIIPKHRLGSEYEMDYALEKASGHFDLVEIESSNLELFTKKGNPTSTLIHAEQQALDWLSWIEKNSSYARERLPGLMGPVGFVVIGKRTSLSPSHEEKLKQRNAAFRGQIEILTYDDLLGRAKNLLRHLEGLSIRKAVTPDYR